MSDIDESKRTRFQWWLEDLSVDPATRVAGAILIIFGSILGVITGSLHITADVGDVLSGQLDESGGSADVTGAVYSALIDNSTGGEAIEGVVVIIEDEEGLEIGRDVTDSGGRFSVSDIARQSSVIVIDHPGYIIEKILIIPGDHAQITVTLTEGEGNITTDMRGESHLDESVLITSIVGFITLTAGIAGILGGVEVYNGKNHFRSQFLSYLGLWSQGLMFIGPLFILIGMGLTYLSREQFGLTDA
tara:strand:+ start:59415 stop:60152 length:738 start_codon:yes stop_codon:yes gene_type:complete